VFSGQSGNERGSSRTLIIYMLSSGTSKFRRNPRASQALTAPREKCPAPVRRHAFALPSLPLARYHNASSTHTQLVVDGSKMVLEDVLCGSNTNDVPVTEALGDEGDDALFPFSWASLPVKIMSEHRRLLYIKVASLTRLMPLVMPKRKNRRLK